MRGNSSRISHHSARAARARPSCIQIHARTVGREVSIPTDFSLAKAVQVD